MTRYRVIIIYDPQQLPLSKKRIDLTAKRIRMDIYINKKQNEKQKNVDRRGISYHTNNSNKNDSPSSIEENHALATTIGGKPSGGLPRFLPVPPPPPPPPALPLPLPLPLPGAPLTTGVADFFFGVSGCCCCCCSMTPTPTPIPADCAIVGINTTGTGTCNRGLVVVSVTGITTGVPVSAFGFGAAAADFFLDPPDAAAAIAALVGRTGCPKGPSLDCAGFGASSVSTPGVLFANRRS